MAGVRYSLRKNVTIPADGAPHTLMQIVAAANTRIRIESVEVDGQSVTSSDVPVNIELIGQTTAGTFGAAVTPQKMVPSDPESVQATVSITPSAEPTYASTPLDYFNLPPQSQRLRTYPPGRDMYVPGGSRLGIVGINPGASGQPINITVFCEE